MTVTPPAPRHDRRRLHLQVQGMVQGVGFRPFVYRLATALQLMGWVRNHPLGVEMEVEGPQADLMTFLARLQQQRPPYAHLARLETHWLSAAGYDQFEIQASQSAGQCVSSWILPDLATCPDCLQELFTPANQRYHYPFINCTHCGPRYSILTALPYDRPQTTMRNFRLCPDCQQEYQSPGDRRFHAQPNACPHCGPQLALWDARGHPIATEGNRGLISQVAACIIQGDIIALKGLGGFHLLVDARNAAAVGRLRQRKCRPSKPLAVMYPNLEQVQRDCQLSPVEAALLTSAAAPIVLLTPRPDPLTPLAQAVAPQQSTLGVMLPYTPLHHLLLAELGFPVVATSGNRSQEPICIDNAEAIAHLSPIADKILVHNRPIARPVDDSVVQVVDHHPMVLRRARGYAPLPLTVESGDSEPLPDLLALGGHLKNTVALTVQGRVVMSQHLGDLGQVKTVQRLQTTLTQMLQLYQSNPVAIACDAHPDYASTQVAVALGQQRGIPVVPIQHHYAHVLSAMAEHRLEPPVLGIAWDGNGYGLDGTLWGGEFFHLPDHQGFERVASVRPFPLPGGERAAREPRRIALGLLYAAWGDGAFEPESPVRGAFSPPEWTLLQTQLQRQVNAPLTASMGRLFEAITALIGLCQVATFEGEAARRLESVTAGVTTTEAYPYQLIPQRQGVLFDWQPLLEAVLADRHQTHGLMAAKFHNTLIDLIVAIAQRVGLPQVVLAGGCFQNRYLLTHALQRLRAAGFQPHWPQQIPANDGGLAAGQLLGAAWQLQHQRLGDRSCA